MYENKSAFLSKLHKRRIQFLRMVWSMEETTKASPRYDVLAEWK